jgi:DNA/RNA-binding domain of Phe-tRNA-synthetase-like protein
MVTVAEEWKKTWSQAHVGIMSVGGIESPNCSDRLDAKKIELVQSLQARFPDKEALLDSATIKAYADYFKRYKKTYHVLLQLESVIFKGKPLPAVSPVVEAMFMAELDSAILTAGHDADKLKMPLQLAVAAGNERYTGIGGREQETKTQDMMMVDGGGVIASVLGGPDARTRITDLTKRCLFVAYAPQGIGAGKLRTHLDKISANIGLFSPNLRVERLEIFGE